MNGERWRRVDECYHAALECPPHQRTGFLDKACADDPELRREVESLLSHEGQADDLLERPVWDHVTPPDETRTLAPTALAAGGMMAEYRIVGKLGSGGMGEVYRATDTRLQRDVALKVLTPAFANDSSWLSRFQREARILASLNHPHIAAVFGLEESGGVRAIAMELVEGPTLGERMARGRIPVAEAISIAMQIAEALEYAHEKGIIHRDVKPANVKLGADNVVKVLDFGLAKAAPTDEAPAVTATGTGMVVGTPAYMAPEQAAGLPVDRRADVWAFGVVLFEMLAGRQVYARKTTLETLAAVARDEPPWDQLPANTSPAVLHLLQRCLDKDPKHRLRDIGEARIAIERLMRDQDSSFPVPAATESAPRGRSFPIALAVVIVLLVVAAGWLFTKLGQRSAPHLKLRQLTTNSMENPVDSAAISPDGKYLAYVDRQGMHIRSIDSGETRTVPQRDVLNGTSCCMIVAWFPDSTRFLITSGYRGPVLTTWMVSVTGEAPRKIREDSASSDISPDGSVIAFTRNRGRIDDREIWLMDANGGNARRFLSADEDSGFEGVRWSPDGHRLAYVKFHLAANQFEIALETRDLHAGSPIPVFSETAATEEAARLSELLWLSDGRMILFMNEPDTRPVSSLTTKCNLWAVRVDTHSGRPMEEPKRLTDWPGGYGINYVSATADGKRITFRKGIGQSAVYVADLEPDGKHIHNPERLTLDEGWNHPSAWTADNRSVILESNRSGHFGIYRQTPGQNTAEAIVTGSDASAPVVSPDGNWILYLVYPTVRGSATPVELLRVPSSGGPPEKVLTSVMYGAPRCANAAAGLCVIAEPASARKQIVFTALDPAAGPGKELAAMDVEPNADYVWDLSPDGTRVAVLKMAGIYTSLESQTSEGPIHILSLNGLPPREIVAKGRRNQWRSLDWAAGGKGLYVSSDTPEGSVLLYLDLHGNADEVWKHSSGDRGTRGIPSRDGRHIALLGRGLNGNVWMIEGF